MKMFRQDNTDGYTNEQLNYLNERLTHLIDEREITDPDEIEQLSEDLLTKFDTYLSTENILGDSMIDALNGRR